MNFSPFVLLFRKVSNSLPYMSDIQSVKERPGNKFALPRVNTFFLFFLNKRKWMNLRHLVENATYKNNATFHIFVFPCPCTQTPMQRNNLLGYDIILGFHVFDNYTFLIFIFCFSVK